MVEVWRRGHGVRKGMAVRSFLAKVGRSKLEGKGRKVVNGTELRTVD